MLQLCGKTKQHHGELFRHGLQTNAIRLKLARLQTVIKNKTILIAEQAKTHVHTKCSYI